MSSTTNNTAPEAVISFWFEEIDSELWFQKDASFDSLVRERFADLHARAAQCELFSWRSSAAGRLAEVIVLDQFSRNMFRDSALAFATDSLALALAQTAVAAGDDRTLPSEQRMFFYMPYMHSESLLVHDEAVRLFAANGNLGTLDFEHKHRTIIEHFGRYPHRNAVLGRDSTAEELEFLAQPGAGF